MKFILTAILFIMTLIAPCVVFFLVFSNLTLYLVTCLFIFLWGTTYIYMDKFLLFVLGAREVFETDEQVIFQSIKNESYKQNLDAPRIYVYSGEGEHAFVLEARKSWSIVIERKMVSKLSGEQIEDLVKFFFEFKKKNMCLLLTKTLGISTFVYQIIFSTLSSVLIFKREKITFKVLSSFLILLVRPFLALVEFLARRVQFIQVAESLKVLWSGEVNSMKGTFKIFYGQFDSAIPIRKLLVSYLEDFSAINYIGKNEK